MTLLLQKELIHAMVDRIEADLKLSIVKSKLMAEEARQAKIFQELQELQAQEDNDRSLWICNCKISCPSGTDAR